MREPVRAPRAAWRMSRQSAERFGRASCMASKSAAKTVTLAAQISANRMELASLPLEKSAARNVTAERSPKAGKLRKLGLRSAHRAMKSGIQGIDCMNGDPDNDAKAMATIER